MNVISISTDGKIFEENSAVRKRQIEYGKFFNELHLIVFTPSDLKFQNQKISSNVFLYPTRSKRRIFYIFDFLRIIRRITKNLGRDNVILTCQDPFETGIVGALVKLFYGLPLHTQVHTDFMHKYFRQSCLLNKIRFMTAEFILKYSDKVRAVSKRIKDSIVNFSENVDILPIKAGSRVTSHELQKRNRDLNILTVCRLEKEKNLETAIKAFKIASEKFPGLTFTIVGDGSQTDKLKNLSRIMNLESKIKFIGWQDNLEKYYEDADIYVSTSLYEGYGLSTVEAASFGIPLLLSDTGLAGDVFKNNDSALVCDAFDSDCFAQNILKLCRNKNLSEEISKRAKGEVSKHLDNNQNYFERYADSIKDATIGFRKKVFFQRVLDFKAALWGSLIYLRYFICGITAAAFNIGSLYFFTDIAGVWYLYSSILAFSLSLVVSFTLQKFVVFKDMKINKMHHQFSKFFIAAVLGVITNTAAIFICVDIFGIWYIFSQIIAGFFVMIQNFILYKFFIFNK